MKEMAGTKCVIVTARDLGAGAGLMHTAKAGGGLMHTAKAGGWELSPTGSPSLLLGNFSSCFLGTSYLQKRGREPLKASRWGAPCLRLSLGRHEVCKSVCACFLRTPAHVSLEGSGEVF